MVKCCTVVFCPASPKQSEHKPKLMNRAGDGREVGVRVLQQKTCTERQPVDRIADTWDETARMTGVPLETLRQRTLNVSSVFIKAIQCGLETDSHEKKLFQYAS